MLALGERVSKCGCRTVRLWTADAGTTWHPTAEAVGSGFVGASGTLWWWRGGRLYRAAVWPPAAGGLRAKHVAHLPGAIVDAGAVPGGVVALVSRRVAGLGLDRSPRLLLVQGKRVRVLHLPRVGGDVLAASIEVQWPEVTVHGRDVTAFTRGEEGSVTWSSSDGGTTWAVTRT